MDIDYKMNYAKINKTTKFKEWSCYVNNIKAIHFNNWVFNDDLFIYIHKLRNMNTRIRHITCSDKLPWRVKYYFEQIWMLLIINPDNKDYLNNLWYLFNDIDCDKVFVDKYELNNYLNNLYSRDVEYLKFNKRIWVYLTV